MGPQPHQTPNYLPSILNALETHQSECACLAVLLELGLAYLSHGARPKEPEPAATVQMTSPNT